MFIIDVWNDPYYTSVTDHVHIEVDKRKEKKLPTYLPQSWKICIWVSFDFYSVNMHLQ